MIIIQTGEEITGILAKKITFERKERLKEQK